MNIIQVPEVFEDYNHSINNPDGPTIINYSRDNEVENVQVHLTKNLIVFVVQGFKKVLGKKENVTIEAGQGFFLRKGHYLMSEKFGDSQGHYKSFLIFFSDQFAYQFASHHSHLIRISDSKEKELSVFNSTSSIDAFLKSLETYFEDPEIVNEPDLADLKLKELFLLLSITDYGDTFTNFLKHLSTQPAYRLRNFMNLHYKENLTLEQYAFLTGYSLSTFRRIFKKEFEMTPARWIQKKKLDDAKFLLRSTPANVTEICYDTGFENLSHFIQSFKKEFGVTPKQFQLEHHET